MKAIYVRVSTEEQSIKGYSIDGQIEDCVKKAGTSNVLKYVDDGYTGEILERPALTKLREDAIAGLITEIICYDPDRLSRKLMIQLFLDDEFKKQGIQLTFVNGEYANTPEGHLFFSMRGAISEFEKAKIKQRTMGGRKQKAKKGKVVKDSKLFGYFYDKEKATLIINEKESKIVKMIFDYYTDSSYKFKGVNGIANHLTETGVPTKNGAKVWHRQVVRQILMNEAYTGKYIQNRYNTEGMYVKRQSGKAASQTIRPEEEWVVMKIPSIIDEDQFQYAQQLLKEGRRRSTKNGIHDYLLSGLVRCGRCGSTMTGRRTLSHGKNFYIYECRKNYAGAKTKGCGKQMSENKLNKIVWEHVVSIFNNPESIYEYQEEEKGKRHILNEMQRIEEELEKNKKGRKRLITLVSLDDDLDLEEIKDQIKTLQEKEQELTLYYNQLQKELTEGESVNDSVFEEAKEMYLKHGDNVPREEQKYIINKCVKEIVVSAEGDVSIYLF
ncbi:recombinase family protein [Peribacillus acanthi]|uniref:recombinase family protein n=1 Tax=Peribacillus acanthi TaxID=2171554 RepID=UPI000D3ED639|nr:recombinase family protein [Peribacillus acanthi]